MPENNCIFKKGTRIMFVVKDHGTSITYDPSGGVDAHHLFPNGKREVFLSFRVDRSMAASIAIFLGITHGLAFDASCDVNGGWIERDNYSAFSFVLK